MTYEELVDHCVALRVAYERDEARFFIGLVEVEQNHMDTLRDAGVDSFDSFLRSCEFTRVERYRAFANGLRHTTFEEAEKMGAPAVIQMSNLRDESKATEYKEAVAAWSSDHRGLSPRQETAAKLLRQVDPRPERPQSLRRLDDMQRLKEENEALKREVARLRKLLAKYEKDSKAA
jgi:hypothetical protein